MRLDGKQLSLYLDQWYWFQVFSYFNWSTTVLMLLQVKPIICYSFICYYCCCRAGAGGAGGNAGGAGGAGVGVVSVR